MANDDKRDDSATAVTVQTWQLPELDGPTVSDEDALGNRRRREQRRQAQLQRTQPASSSKPAPETEPEAEVIEPPTAAELQALRDAAREEGFVEGRAAGEQAGYKAGHQEGLAAGREEGFDTGKAEGLQAAEADTRAAIETAQREAAASLAQAIAALNTREQALEEELAPVIRDLVLRLTQGLVVQSLQQSPEQIEDIVHQAIQLMPSAHERMQILLHPDDCSMLKGLELHWLRQVDLQPDDALSPGGCMVKTRHSLLDYTLDQRYQKQIQALLEQPIEDSSHNGDSLRSLGRDRFQALVEQSESVTHHRNADDDEPETAAVDDIESGAEEHTPEESDETELQGAETGNAKASGTEPEDTAQGSDSMTENAAEEDDDSTR